MAIHQINPTSRELPASQKVQCHSALCLQSGHTQQRVHFAMTVFTSGIHKCSSLQALLRKRDQTSPDPQNTDCFTLLCYLQNLVSFPCSHFVDFFFTNAEYSTFYMQHMKHELFLSTCDYSQFFL